MSYNEAIGNNVAASRRSPAWNVLINSLKYEKLRFINLFNFIFFLPP